MVAVHYLAIALAAIWAAALGITPRPKRARANMVCGVVLTVGVAAGVLSSL